MAAPMRNLCTCGFVIFPHGTLLPESTNSSLCQGFRTYLIGNHVATKKASYYRGSHKVTKFSFPSGSVEFEMSSRHNKTIESFNSTISACFMSRRCQLLRASLFTSDFSCGWRSFTVSTRNVCSSKRADDASRTQEQQKGHEQTRTGLRSPKADLAESVEPMKENIKTIPNLLTTLRMASAPFLGYLVVCESFTLALSIFALAGVSDLLDGFIARNFKNQTSVLGTALDPLADKLLVTVLSISMTSVGLIPLPLTALIVFRDLVLIGGGFYIRYRSLPVPPPLIMTSTHLSCPCHTGKQEFLITLSRYFDISHATAKLSPTLISKLNTSLQLSLVAFSLAAPVFGFVNHIFLQTLWYATGTTTLLSGADYMWSWKKYVTLLEKDQKDL